LFLLCFRNRADDQSPLMFVGSDNKKLLCLSVPLAVAVGQGTRNYSPVDSRIRGGQVLGERLSERVSQISAD